MVNITISIPEEVKQSMDNFPEINWSGVAKKAIIEKTTELTWKEEMLKKLEKEKDFEAWAIEMGKKVNKDVAKAIKKKGLI